MERVFNSAFLFLLSCLFSARVFYVIFHFEPKFINPFAFVSPFYIPGLSLFGAFAGGALFITLYFKPAKNPRPRMFDFFSASFLFAYAISFLVSLVLSFPKRPSPLSLAELFFLIVICLVFLLYLIPRQRRGGFKDLSLGIIFYLLFCPVVFIQDQTGRGIVFLNAENILLLITFLASLLPFIIREKTFFKR